MGGGDRRRASSSSSSAAAAAAAASASAAAASALDCFSYHGVFPSIEACTTATYQSLPSTFLSVHHRDQNVE